MAQVIERTLLTEADLPDRRLTELISDPNTTAELKIGVSTGRFLCEMARFYNDRLFVGIEVKPRASRIAAQRILIQELTNAVVVNIEAHHFIRTWVSDQVFDAVHIYFPTPFPSSIGLPRRLINPAFVADVHRILRPFGTLRVVTDHKEYYEEICGCVKARDWWAQDWQRLELTSPNYFVGTRQEVSYREEGHPQIYALRLLRIAPPPNGRAGPHSSEVAWETREAIIG